MNTRQINSSTLATLVKTKHISTATFDTSKDYLYDHLLKYVTLSLWARKMLKIWTLLGMYLVNFVYLHIPYEESRKK